MNPGLNWWIHFLQLDMLYVLGTKGVTVDKISIKELSL